MGWGGAERRNRGMVLAGGKREHMYIGDGVREKWMGEGITGGRRVGGMGEWGGGGGGVEDLFILFKIKSKCTLNCKNSCEL